MIHYVIPHLLQSTSCGVPRPGPGSGLLAGCAAIDSWLGSAVRARRAGSRCRCPRRLCRPPFHGRRSLPSKTTRHSASLWNVLPMHCLSEGEVLCGTQRSKETMLFLNERRTSSSARKAGFYEMHVQQWCLLIACKKRMAARERLNPEAPAPPRPPRAPRPPPGPPQLFI